jgi:hypothetical protein
MMSELTGDDLTALRQEVSAVISNDPEAASYLYLDRWKTAVITILDDACRERELDLLMLADRVGISRAEYVLTGQATLDETIAAATQLMDFMGVPFHLSVPSGNRHEGLDTGWSI